MDDESKRDGLAFEFFKHMSTLAAAAIAAVVTAGQLLGWGLIITILSLGFFTHSLLCAVYGMAEATKVFDPSLRELQFADRWIFKLVRLITRGGARPNNTRASVVNCTYSFFTALLILLTYYVVFIVHSGLR